MKFKHAEQLSLKRLSTCLSFSRLGCILGCVLIAFLVNLTIVLNGTPTSDLSNCAGLSHAASSGPVKFADEHNLLPTEAFLSSEQKYDPFLMLLSLRALCNSCAQTRMRSFIAWSSTRSRGRLYQQISRTFLTRILHSVQLLC
jgi:hypothetical protein